MIEITPRSTPGTSRVTSAVDATILLPVVGRPVKRGFSAYWTISISVPVTLYFVYQLMLRVVAESEPKVIAMPEGSRRSSTVGVTETFPA